MEFILLLISHIFGFYIVQPNWLFENKYKNLFILFLSNCLYGLTTFMGFIVLLGVFYFTMGSLYFNTFIIHSFKDLNWPVYILYYLVISHFIIDRVSNLVETFFRIKYQSTDKEMWKSFEKYAVGIENFLHILNIYLINYIYLV